MNKYKYSQKRKFELSVNIIKCFQIFRMEKFSEREVGVRVFNLCSNDISCLQSTYGHWQCRRVDVKGTHLVQNYRFVQGRRGRMAYTGQTVCDVNPVSIFTVSEA